MRGLLESGGLDDTLKGGLRDVVWRGDRRMLMRLLRGSPKLMELLGSEELKKALRQKMLGFIARGHAYLLRNFLESPGMRERLESGELDDTLKKGLRDVVWRGDRDALIKLLRGLPELRKLLNDEEFYETVKEALAVMAETATTLSWRSCWRGSGARSSQISLKGMEGLRIRKAWLRGKIQR